MPIPYVEYGGTQMLQPPYVAQDVSFYAFLVPANLATLQKMLDERLNQPSGGAVQFQPAGPFVLFAFNSLGKMFSMKAPDRNKGWFSERECAVWVRVIDRKSERSMWFLPYIFVDDAYALVLGRELYGFPKAFGWFQIPDKPENATSMWLETLALPTFSPETKGVRMRLISATQVTPAGNLVREFETSAELLEMALGLLTPQRNVLGDLELLMSSLEDLLNRREPMVFLKQFPAVEAPGVACYQAIVEMTANATAVHGFSFVPGEWQIDIEPAASHPIASDLGLAGNSIKCPLALWVGFDMDVNCGRNIWVASDEPAVEKIAILGGGVGSISTALELTSDANWKSKYDITIYQMGWRLGGKGASGRGEQGRIEEHGLHIWLGFYENAFRIMRQVYEENKVNRPVGSPLRDWTEAFKTHDFVALMDRPGKGSAAEWEAWPIHLPPANGVPGDGISLGFWDTFTRFLGWIKEIYEDSEFHKRGGHPVGFRNSLADVKSVFGHLLVGFEMVVDIGLMTHLELAVKIVSTIDSHTQFAHEGIAQLLHHFRKAFRELIQDDLIAGNAESRRLFQIIDLGVTIAIGLLRGGYLLNPAMLNTLEDELQVWLKNQGADPLSYDVRQSAIIRGLYDLVFAYENGDETRPSFETGPALRSMLLIVGAYKGCIFWKMQAGMGDVVFGPMYEVLKSRGVKFEFFHRVEKLELNAAATDVQSIQMSVQATLKTPSQEYDPLVECEGLRCWPAQPKFQHLVEGEQLRAGAVNLESFWSTWKNPATKVLTAGKDFDRVVLGISLGALPYLFEDVTKLSNEFQDMLTKVQTVRTQAMQVWVNQPLDKLGWEYEDVVLDAFCMPINTWAVMNQLLCRESWPEGSVKGIHYFCGQMLGGIPARDDSEAPFKALKEVEENWDQFVKKYLPLLWPKMNNADFRIVSKFLRCNIDPSERYVLSVAHSTKFRLAANESGINNLVLAGDWTRNGFNAGCVEAAVMSGIQAANAIAGRPLNEGINGPLASQLDGAQKAAAV